jgi:hypothetical protein
MDYILNPAVDAKIQEFPSAPHPTAPAIQWLGHLAVLEWSTVQAAAKSAAGVHAAITLTTAVQTITASITNPPCARNISIVGGHADQTGIDVVITGTNVWGDVITESITMNGTGTVLGAKAFKTVTSIGCPIRASTNTPTVAIGFDDKFGLPFLCNHIDQIVQASLNYAVEATRATLAASSTAIESNTVILASATNGTVIRALLAVYKE